MFFLLKNYTTIVLKRWLKVDHLLELIHPISGPPGDLLNHLSWYSNRHHVGRYISCHYSTSAYHSPLPYAHTIGDDRTGPDPYVVLNYNSLGGNPLFDDGPGRVMEDMIDSQYLYQRCQINFVADSHPPLSPDNAELTDETIAADLYPRVRYLAKVVDVQFSVVHYKAVVTDLNTTRASVQVDSVVNIDIVAKADVIRLP
jgi:hypothetical protein